MKTIKVIKSVILMVVFTMVVNTMNAQTYIYVMQGNVKDSVFWSNHDTIEVNVNVQFTVDGSMYNDGNQIMYYRKIDNTFIKAETISNTNYIATDGNYIPVRPNLFWKSFCKTAHFLKTT